jgi:hypothetical protein
MLLEVRELIYKFTTIIKEVFIEAIEDKDLPIKYTISFAILLNKEVY